MNFADFSTVLAQTAEVEQPGLFPFPFGTHLIFCIISVLFFAFRFSREKSPYQLIFAVAIPFSLTLWISDSRTFFYFVGIVECLAIIAALITSIVFRKPLPAANAPAAENSPADKITESESKAEPDKEEKQGE